jgi:hypothetical protein
MIHRVSNFAFSFNLQTSVLNVKRACIRRFRMYYNQPLSHIAFKLRRYATAATTAAAAAVAANIKAKTAAGVCVKSQAGG